MNVEIATSFDPFFNCSIRVSSLIALSTGDIKIMGPRRPPQVSKRIFVLRVKRKSKLSLMTMDLHMLLSRKKA